MDVNASEVPLKAHEEQLKEKKKFFFKYCWICWRKSDEKLCNTNGSIEDTLYKTEDSRSSLRISDILDSNAMSKMTLSPYYSEEEKII